MGNASSMVYQENNNSLYRVHYDRYKYEENKKLLDIFSILSDKDKNIMIDYIASSLCNSWNSEFNLFLISLQDTNINDIIKDNLRINLGIVNEGKNTSTLEKFKYIENIISSVDKEILEFYSLDYDEKDNIINEKVESFVENGDFKTYLFLNTLLKNADNMFQRVSNSLEKAISSRKYRLTNN
ncbi:hypothetical protein [Fowlpox virus]|nr:hypothetical protein [Fowlpox virus]